MKIPLTRENLRSYVLASIKGVPLSPKILKMNYTHSGKSLIYQVIISEKLTDEELEDLRVSQTEVFSAFCDGQLLRFVIQELQPSPGGDITETLEEVAYVGKTTNSDQFPNQYKLVNEEIAEAEDPW